MNCARYVYFFGHIPKDRMVIILLLRFHRLSLYLTPAVALSNLNFRLNTFTTPSSIKAAYTKMIHVQSHTSAALVYDTGGVFTLSALPKFVVALILNDPIPILS